MTRMKQIIEACKAAVETTTKVSDLTMEAQVSLAYNCVKSAFNSAQYWDQQMANAIAEDKYDNARYCEQRGNEARQAIPSLLTFLHHAANYVEAVLVIGDFDHASVNSDTGEVTDDEIEAERYASPGHPHAWAKQKLQTLGLWPENFHSVDSPTLWYNLPPIADRTAGQVIGDMARMLVEGVEDINTKSMTKALEIAGLSPALKSAVKTMHTYKALIALSKKYPSWDRELEKPVPVKQLVETWERLMDLDEDDQFREDTRKDVREIKTSVRDAVRTTLRTQSLLQVLTESVSKLKEAGVSDDVIAKFTADITAKV